MMQPKRRKYQKDFRGRRKGESIRGSALAFGEHGLKSLETAWVSGAQIESARRAITGTMKKGGKVWIRVFPDKPVTSRAAGQRMGGGKGDISKYVAVVKPGKILFEMSGTTELVVKEAFDKASAKLPVKTKVIAREI